MMRSPESDFSSRIKEENGSALLYILFLIALIAIVGSVMLTTVTQGQRNVVKSEGDLTHFYKAEGALEIIIADLKANKGDAWSELESYINSREDPIELSIGGDSVFINVVPDSGESSVRLTDIKDESIYREITFVYLGNSVGGYPIMPGPDSPVLGGDGPGKFYECVENTEGELNCSEISPLPHYYNAAEQDPPQQFLIFTGSSDVEAFTNEVNYSAPLGIYIEPNLATRTGNKSMTFDSSDGFIIIDGATFKTNHGNFGDIIMKAGTYISAAGSTIDANAGKIILTANQNDENTNQYINLEGADLDSKNAINIIVNPTGGCVNIKGTIFRTNASISPSSVRVVGTPALGSVSGGISDPNGTCP